MVILSQNTRKFPARESGQNNGQIMELGAKNE